MKRYLLCASMALLSGTVFAADKDDVSAAIAKLAAADNYSWHVTTTNIPDPNAPAPGGGGGRGGFGGGRGFGRRGGGPMDAKTQKDGLIYVSRAGRGGQNEGYVKGDKGAVKAGDGDWTSFEDAANDQGPATFFANQVKAQKSAADEAKAWLAAASDFKKSDDGYTGTLTEEATKASIPAQPFGDPPTISNAKGSVSFWVTDGTLSKYERHLWYTSVASFNDNTFTNNVNQITTVEIKDIGSTKIDLPDDAKAKMK